MTTNAQQFEQIVRNAVKESGLMDVDDLNLWLDELKQFAILVHQELKVGETEMTEELATPIPKGEGYLCECGYETCGFSNSVTNVLKTINFPEVAEQISIRIDIINGYSLDSPIIVSRGDKLIITTKQVIIQKQDKV
jgi:hypothetical protein